MIELLFDGGTIVELDELARHRSTALGLEMTRPYGDGVVTDYGVVNGRLGKIDRGEHGASARRRKRSCRPLNRHNLAGTRARHQQQSAPATPSPPPADSLDIEAT